VRRWEDVGQVQPLQTHTSAADDSGSADDDVGPT